LKVRHGAGLFLRLNVPSGAGLIVTVTLAALVPAAAVG
jgi:hypothetical protein